MEKESGYLYSTISLLIRTSEGTETCELVRRFAIYAGKIVKQIRILAYQDEASSLARCTLHSDPSPREGSEKG